MGSAPDRQRLTRLAMLFGEHGIGSDRRPDRLRLCSDHAGRLITSMSRLTTEEADTLERRLQALPRNGGLLHRVAQLIADEENNAALAAASALPATVIVCGRGGTVSDADANVVREFAEFLTAQADGQLALPDHQEEPPA